MIFERTHIIERAGKPTKDMLIMILCRGGGGGGAGGLGGRGGGGGAFLHFHKLVSPEKGQTEIYVT